jgi:orotate phosphoribosyltransferase
VPCGVAIALDRMERGTGELSAVQEVERYYDMPVVSIAKLDDLIEYLRTDGKLSANLTAVNEYRKQYGVTAHA